MSRATRSALAVVVLAFALGGCSFAGRLHLGDVWLSGGHGISLVGSRVALGGR